MIPQIAEICLSAQKIGSLKMTIEAGSVGIVWQLVLCHLEISNVMQITVGVTMDVTMGDMTCFDMSKVSTTSKECTLKLWCQNYDFSANS